MKYKISEIIEAGDYPSSYYQRVLTCLRRSDEYKDKLSVHPIKGDLVEGDLDEILSEVDNMMFKLQAEENARVREEKSQVYQEKKQAEKREKLLAESVNFMTTTGQYFEGYVITEYGGCIAADAVTAVQRQLTHLSNIGVEKGKTKTAVKLVESLQSLRREALSGLKAEAAECGCNAVIGVSYNYITLDPLDNPYGATGNSQPYIFCVTASGTAVKIEIEEE